MLTLRALSAFCAVSLCMISSSLAFQIKVTNNCNEPIAVAASQHKWNESISDFPLLDRKYTGSPILSKGKVFDIEAPSNWVGGRVWARQGCTGEGASMVCRIGNCPNGGQFCDDYNFETGDKGMTVAEFGTNRDGSNKATRVYINLSRVQGWNVGMKLTGGTRDLNCPAEDCPTDQAYLADSDHQAVIDADPYTANFRLTLCP